MAIKIFLKNHKVVVKNVYKKTALLRSNAKHLFEVPLVPILDAIKRDVKGNANFNHINTGELYANTKSESKSTKTSEGFKTSVDFGYFVKYGLNLETFQPRTVSLPDLRAWSVNKSLNWSDSQLKTLRRKLQTDPNVYPIIQGVWGELKDSVYLVDVYNRLKKIWVS